jgi:opacity protein-like surface antigen
MRRLIFASLIFLNILPLGQAGDISIQFSGGIKYGLLRDVNSGIRGYLGLYADSGTYYGGTVIDKTKSLHFVPNYSVGFSLKFNSDYSIGLDVGRIRANHMSEITIRYPDERPEDNAFVETTIDSVPIRLSVFRYYALNRAMKAYFAGGLEIYPTRFRSVNWPAGAGNTLHQSAHSIGLGLLYGAGLEIKVLSDIALVLEALGNYAKIGKLKGTLLAEGSSLPYEIKGTLYYWEQATTIGPDFQEIYSHLMIQESAPSGDPYSHVRSAKIDLSGFTLTAGVKIFF